MMRAVVQPFVLSLGAPMTAVGLLESLGGMHGIVTASLQYYSGWLSDRLGRKPFMILASVAGVLGAGLFIAAALTGEWLLLVPGVMLAGATYLAQPADQSMVAESSEAGRRGTAYSLLMMGSIAPGIFAPALGGWLAGSWGFAVVFALQGVLYVLALLLVVRFLRETLSQSDMGLTRARIKEATVRLVVPPRGLRGYYLTMAVDSFTWGLGFTLLFGMLTQTYGMTTLQLGIMSSLMALTWTLSQWPVGKLIDRFGSKPIMVVSLVACLPILVGFMVVSSFAAFAALWACMGFAAATWVPVQRVLLADRTAHHALGESMGRLSAFQGLFGFPAPFIGGLLYDAYGFRAPLYATFLGTLVTVVLLITLVEEPRRAGRSRRDS
jgi:MFS family permease